MAQKLAPGTTGEITVRRLPAGNYQAQCWKRDLNGAKRKTKRNGKTSGEAIRQLKKALQTRQYPNIKTVGDLLDTWLATHTGIAQATRERYTREIDCYIKPHIKNLDVDEVTTPILQRAIDQVHIDISRSAAKHARGRMRQAFAWGTRMGIFDHDPSAPTTITGRAPRKYVHAPSTQEIQTLRQALTDQLHSERSGPKPLAPLIAFEIMAGTGARIGEVCHLDWEDIDLEENTVKFRDTVTEENGKQVSRGHLKNQDPYRINYLPASLTTFLRAHQKDTGPVVANRYGRRITTNNLRRAWRTAYANAGIPEENRLTPHAIRRAVASKIAAELGAEYAAQQLGDTITVAIQHYIAPTFTGPKDAARVLQTL